MSNLDLNDEQVAGIRTTIDHWLGLNLSDEEIETLLTGEALSFTKLAQSRSLSEIGVALIRADTLSRLPKTAEVTQLACPNGQPPTCVPLTNICFCPANGSSPLELRMYPD